MSSASSGHRPPGDARPGAAGGPPGRADTSGSAGTARRAVSRARDAAVRDAAVRARRMAAGQAERPRLVRELFSRPVHDHAGQALGRPLAVLRAGCQGPARELGLDQLRASGYEISVTTVDEDGPAARAILAAAGGPSGGPAEGPAMLGDLRSVPLPPRSFDVVHCVFLLDRIPHATLVLDRFVAALRPGGLLLLRIRDRDCAAATLDRLAPDAVRRYLWARLRAGEPGPFPAVYDPVSSAGGIPAYALSHGLVIVQRETTRSDPGRPGRLSSAVGAAQALIGRLSRGRLTNAHDELLYVIRKPEDRFARLL